MATAVLQLLLATERMLGLRLCFKDLDAGTEIPERLREHSDPACTAVKSTHLDACHAWCSVACARDVSSSDVASIRRCPFGHSELVCPVLHHEILIGWLSAGPLWLGKGRAPRAGLHKPDNKQWYTDRMEMLSACAARLSQLLSNNQHSRYAQLMQYLQENMHKELSLSDIADLFHLSESRCGHLVKELSGMTFPQLLRHHRCRRAANILISEEISAAAVGRRVGIADPSWFSDSFRQVYGYTPGSWREKMRKQV